MSLVDDLLKTSLSLRIAPEPSPFALVGTETTLSPEDWAWQFLRLNEDYRQAYTTAQEKQAVAIHEKQLPGRWPMPHVCRKITVDEDVCRNRFGLSTWLDPKRSQLPELKRGESWFSPLCPVGIMPINRTSFSSYPYLKGPFGLAKEVARRHRPPGAFRIDREHYRSPRLRFLIDSTVPPEGQLAEITGIARYVRERQANAHTAAPNSASQAKTPVVKVFTSGSFSRKDRGPPLEPRQQGSRAPALWSTVEIDFHYASDRAIETIRGKLKERHEKLVEKQLANEPPWTRFRSELFSPRQPETDSVPGATSALPTDGHSLKAYAIIALLIHEAGLPPDARELERVIALLAGTAASSAPVLTEQWKEWVADRELRIRRYIAKARDFVQRDYRWLIHTQKPDTKNTKIKI